MIALATVLIVVGVSLLITRVATVALSLTGLSREVARFQARSALSGVGYTTKEAEAVLDHPVRRRIILWLMIVGSGGIVTAVATLMLSFSGATRSEVGARALVLIAGLIVVLLIARSRRIDRRLSRVISWALRRWTDVESRDYAELLRLAHDYAVLELAVQPGDWVANRTLSDISLRQEGIAVLGIERPSGDYIAAPTWSTEVHPEDTLIVYGPTAGICELDQRRRGPEGDRAHAAAVSEHEAALASNTSGPLSRTR